MPGAGARGEGGEARDARSRAHRPRIPGRRRRALPRGTQPWREADRRLRGLCRGRPARAEEGLRAPDAACGVERGLLEPDQALLARVSRGVLLQAARRLGAPRAPCEGARRALGMPLGTGVEGARGGKAEGRARGSRPPRTDLRSRLDVRGAAERRPRRAAGRESRAHRARRGDRSPAGRDRRRALPRRRGRALARGPSLHPVGRHAQEPESLALRHERVLLQVARGDGSRLPGARARARAHPRGRGALLGRDRARTHPAAELPRPRRTRRFRLSRRALREGAPQAVRKDDPRAHRAASVRAQDRSGDGLRGLLPDRLGLHPLREAERGQRRPRPRLLGGLARRLLPRDHGRRPDALRPALRALPEPGAEGLARHGHRLLRGGPRPRHQLRRGQVRARPGRPDHHVLDDGGQGGDPGRGTRPRHSLRGRRPHRKARARGPGADARRTP